MPPDLVGGEVLDGAAEEHLADHRRPLDHDAIDRTEPVEASGQERLDRRRDHDRADLADQDPASAVIPSQDPVVQEHREHLLDEQRVALGGLDDLRSDLRVELRGPEEVRRDLGAVLFGQCLQDQDAVVFEALAPSRVCVDEIGSG